MKFSWILRHKMKTQFKSVLIIKKKRILVDLAVPADHRVKVKEGKKLKKKTGPYLRAEKTVKQESDCDTNSSQNFQ